MLFNKYLQVISPNEFSADREDIVKIRNFFSAILLQNIFLHD